MILIYLLLVRIKWNHSVQLSLELSGVESKCKDRSYFPHTILLAYLRIQPTCPFQVVRGSPRKKTPLDIAKTHCHYHASQLIPEEESSKQTIKLNSDMYHVGETLLSSNVGYTSYIRIEKITIDPDAVLHFWVRTTSDEIIKTTKEFLRVPNNPDIGQIPTSKPNKKEVVSTLSEKESKQVTNPVRLLPLQEVFQHSMRSYGICLSQLCFAS